MGSLSTPAIPTLHFTRENLAQTWLSTSDAVRLALEEYGCFIAEYDEVPEALQTLTFDALESLFALPLETKRQNSYSKPLHGYVGQFAVIPLHEGMGIQDGTTLEGIQHFASLMWPQGNQVFCDTMHSFAKILADLDLIVTRMIFDSYKVSHYYARHLEPMGYLIRMMKYRVPDSQETDVGFIPHTDKNFTTILYQNQVDGLEIETKNGEWISVKLSPSSFIVIAGDAIMAWSNGRIQSPNHKVTMKNRESTRYSLGLFTFSNGEIKAPDELVDDQHPLQFKPFEHMGYLRAFHAYQGPKSECPLKSYCGV
uniref:Fe2OG dioxygenase domain-containing protein n=1 Tax=Kalanchoe fedtschenkoi TaxID=63787 RepID=A0A7N0RHN7_KALFE